MYQPKVPITDAAEVKAILGADVPTQVGKVIDHIDAYCRAWIERCPFIVISSINAAGAMDTSPKGDPPGFVRVLDKHTLAIPERLGNHRGDTFFNVLENPSVGIVFIVPKRREVVRVSGTASLARDPDLLATPARNDCVCEGSLFSLREINAPPGSLRNKWVSVICPLGLPVDLSPETSSKNE